MSNSLDQEASFLFESLESNGYGEVELRKQIYGFEIIESFNSLEALEEFIEENYEKLKDTEAGIAGYISYEGEVCFTAFEKIHENNTMQTIAIDSSEDKAANDNYEILEPSPKEYMESIEKCKNYIEEGDIYQANLTRKFRLKSQAPITHEELQEVYGRLRTSNPAPYSGFMDMGNYVILSSSPESFFKTYLENGKLKISTSPIKGTADLKHREFLENSAKDKAEHIMIVDLERNDLGRICLPGSINAEELMKIRRFENLYHYVSTVAGELNENLYSKGLKIKQILDAIFPGGSITGAPKIRSMEIIKELEPVSRGLYTGCMGYIKFNGESEFNILIRSIFLDKQDNEFSFNTGGGITYYSDPQAELEESELKAEKIFETILGSKHKEIRSRETNSEEASLAQKGKL